jgi:hypothetical protein
MRRPQFRGFWGRASAGVTWLLIIANLILGMAITVFALVFFWPLAFLNVVPVGFWCILAWMKWRGRTYG